MRSRITKSIACAFLACLGLSACGRSQPVALKPEVAQQPSQPAVATTPEVEGEFVDSVPLEQSLEQVTSPESDAAKEPESEVSVTETEDASVPPANAETAETAETDETAETAETGETQLATESVIPPEPSTPEPTGPPPVRLFLPTTVGALIVDVDVNIGEKNLADAFDDRMSELMSEAGDDDEESELTWTQVFDHVRSDPQRFGRQPVDPANYKEMIRRYDMNRNKKPESQEVAKFLFRNAGFAGPFRLSGTDHYRNSNRLESALFKAIDTNHNRVLDSDELDRAASALMRVDQNSDQRINLSEASVMQPDNDPAWNRRRVNRRGEVAMDLQGYIDWTMVSYSLDDMLDDSPLGIVSPAVSSIDQDGDNSVSGEEAKTLREAEPDLTLLVRFADSMSDSPTVEIVSMRPELELPASSGEPGKSVSLVGDSLRLTAIVEDMPVRQNQIPLEVFAMLDANSDGGLDETEIPAQAAEQFSFEKLDADEDGKLTFKEINDGSREAEPYWSMQVRGRAAEFPDAVFAWLDRDHDLILSEREILGAGERLRRDEVEALRPADIPDAFVIQLVRGDPGQDNQHFRFSQQPSSATESVPKWAGHMDTNGDGDISAAEFIGTVKQFQEIDVNHDGFIDHQEVLLVGQ